MKKALFSLAALAFMATATMAQDAKTKMTPKGMTFGINGGVGGQKFTGDDDLGNNLDTKFAVKGHLGVDVDIPVGTDFYFRPGLTLIQKGAKVKETILGTKYETEANLFYLDIPLNFIYKVASSGAGHFAFGFGPYVGFGIGGKIKTTSGSNEVKQDVEYRGTVKSTDPQDKAYFKRFDGGANLLAAYEFASGFSVGLGGQMSLTDINSDYEGQTNDKSKTKNLGIVLNLGWRFNK